MQRLTLFSTMGAAARMMVAVLWGATMAVATPAQAQQVALTGITSGQVVSGPVVLGAIGDDKTLGMTLQLTGPNGYTRVATSDGNAVNLQTAGAGGPAAWDPGAHPEGKYRLTATVRRSVRGSGRLATGSAWFTVRRALAGTPPTGAEVAEGAALTFAAQMPSRHAQGTGRALDLVFRGTLPADGDVMLLCWDEDHSRLVPEFTAYLKSGPWQISAEKLSLLPVGRMELQAHLRRGGRVVQSVRHPIQIVAFTPEASPQPNSPATTIFEGVETAPSTSTQSTVGGGTSAGSSAGTASTPRRAGGGGVSSGNGQSTTSTPEPSVAAATPTAAATSPSIADVGVVTPSAVVLTLPEPAATSTPIASVPTPVATTVTATPSAAPETVATPVATATSPVFEIPTGPVLQSAPVAQGVPTTAVSSGPGVVVESNGATDLPVLAPLDLPRNGVVEVVAWSIDQGRLIHTFTHTLDATSLAISAERLRGLPEGRVELQFTAVVDGQSLAPTFHTISVVGALAEAGSGGLTVASATPSTGSPVVSTSAPQGSSVTDTSGAPSTSSTPTTSSNTPATGSNNGSTTTTTSLDPVETAASSVPEASPEPETPAVAEAPAVPEAPVEPEIAEVAPVDLEGLNQVDTGFTVFAPSDDTRTIYVAENGNDANAGTSPSTAVKTFIRARDLIRDGFPDHVRFKAGDTFNYGLGRFNMSGRSVDEPMVFGVYGDGARPKFDVPDGNFLDLLKNGGPIANIAVQGLHAEAAPRNPNREGFKPNAADRPESVHRQTGFFGFGDVSNVLIEDCMVEWFKDALVFQGKPADESWVRNLTLRRNIIVNSYSVSSEGHSQGLYAEMVDGLVLEENTFDHNGWSDQVEGGQRTLFNHNVYIQFSVLNVTLTGNILSRGASHGAQVRSGGDVINNLFVRNALAMFVARSKSLVAHNVVLQSTDITADLPRGFGIAVLPGPDTLVVNNIISQRFGSAFFAEAIGIQLDRDNLTEYSGPTRVEVTDNKVYRWLTEQGRMLPFRFDGIPDAVVIEARNGVDTTSGAESDQGWVDPERDVDSYMGSIGKTASFEAFAAAIAARPRGQWLPELSSVAVNSYVRRGFDVPTAD